MERGNSYGCSLFPGLSLHSSSFRPLLDPLWLADQIYWHEFAGHQKRRRKKCLEIQQFSQIHSKRKRMLVHWIHWVSAQFIFPQSFLEPLKGVGPYPEFGGDRHGEPFKSRKFSREQLQRHQMPRTNISWEIAWPWLKYSHSWFYHWQQCFCVFHIHYFMPPGAPRPILRSPLNL